MKRHLTTLLLLAVSIATLQAQSEYRITQELPNDINSLYIPSGWVVKLVQAPQASITIVTPCQSFYDDANEPQVCSIEGQKLTVSENAAMPRSTVLEIALAAPIKYLDVQDSANITTGRLIFEDNSHISIKSYATVKGTTWSGKSNLRVNSYSDGNLKLDSLLAEGKLDVHCGIYSSLDCPVVLSPDTYIHKDKHSFGTTYATDTNIHLKVKRTNLKWAHNRALTLSFGLSAPIPLYMNNKSGSPYNRGENYRMSTLIGMGDIKLSNHLSLEPRYLMEFDWSRLLNQVTTDGKSLTLSDDPAAEAPQQHLYSTSIGLDLTLNYSIGKKSKTGFQPLNLSGGLSAMLNSGGCLVTRTMDSDNRWHKTRQEADIFNLFQLRVHLGIGGGPITRATLSFFYDLLPTFRSDIGAKNIHTFGITLSL